MDLGRGGHHPPALQQHPPRGCPSISPCLVPLTAKVTLITFGAKSTFHPNDTKIMYTNTFRRIFEAEGSGHDLTQVLPPSLERASSYKAETEW